MHVSICLCAGMAALCKCIQRPEELSLGITFYIIPLKWGPSKNLETWTWCIVSLANNFPSTISQAALGYREQEVSMVTRTCHH